MIHTVTAITMLAQQCAPEIATEAVAPLVVTESGGDDLAININKGPRVRAASVADGAALVRRYMAAGYTVDVGLAQINSANFARLGVTVEQAFDPCTNLRLASSMLRAGYGLASQHYTGLDAISATYSLYNTGTLTRGFRNGYVGRVWSAASSMGTIQTPPPIPGLASASAPTATPASAKQGIDEASWVVGQIDSSAVQVFK
ncbi:type IV secretion system protein VirB1 [Sphingomonas aurantiaca]|uniref:Type IV secretion system protein VirB1 n=1 Tax=Sphingomonas aurantiaca TaxID=185949 RepID=A0A2T5GHC5_9SPHN|nr:lytic transglycosylase domain-containing protein [Sphingomonas aurantiaca]PTQ58729.1 type IV secretion system protein VirB1 [Sphingomonas aurantiaca]